MKINILNNTLRFQQIILPLLFCSSIAVGQQIFVDNDNGGPEYTETGSWNTTSNVGSGWNAGVYRFTNESPPAATAIWTPTIPTEGFYKVSAIYRRGGDRPASAPYTVNHADGNNLVSLDQTGSFAGSLGQESLGTYRFLAGTSGSVVLSNTGSDGAYISDTILFEAEPPPEVLSINTSPLYPQENDPIQVNATVIDNSGIQQVLIEWDTSPSGMSGSVEAFDNGLAGDTAAGDDIYKATLPGFPDNEIVSITVKATDIFSSEVTSSPTEIEIGVQASWSLVINEVLSSNAASAFDPDFGGTGDWIEIYNEGPDTADLTGHALSDDLSNPDKWLFPSGSSIPAQEYILVWCDDEDFSGNALHTSFKLSSGGEDAVLYNTVTQTIIDSTSFPALESDQSWARIPNISGDFESTINATPLAENLSGNRGGAPEFSISSGIYNTPQSVEITAADSTAIYYTLNGTEPDSNSTEYTVPIIINSTTSLRAKAFYDTLDPSVSTSASYLFDLPQDRQIPIMSIVMDPSELNDIYTNFEERGRAWERAVHVSVISPDGEEVDESGAGIRIHGGFSRTSDKKSFRLYFRNSYEDNEWSLPWLERSENDAFSQLVLRASGNDGFLVPNSAQLAEATLVRDQILRDMFADQGHFASDGFFTALYINGQYFGLFNAIERITDDTMQRVEGDGEYDIIKGTWTFETKFFTEAPDGDLDEWNNFLQWHDSSDLSTVQDFEELKNRMDLSNFLDWMALNIVAQNEDWPHNNWIASRARDTPDAKIIFHEWDAEWGLGLRPQGWSSDSLIWTQGNNFHNFASQNGFIAPLSKLFNGNDLNRLGSNPTVNGVLDNPEGVRGFIDAIEDFLNFEFSEQEISPQFERYVSLIESEIPREAERWATSSLSSETQLINQWPVAVQNMRDFFENRPDVIRGLIMDEFSLAGTKTYTFESAGTGTGFVSIRGEVVELPWTGTFFDGSSANLVAIPAGGSTFVNWSGGINSTEQELGVDFTVGNDVSVTVTFNDTSATGPQPNDVIINEYWVNDDPTDYQIGRIEGDWVELLVVKDGINLTEYRLTDNRNIADQFGPADGSGSLIFPSIESLENVPAGTIILVISSINETNDATFAIDDIDHSDGRLVLYVGNGNLNTTTDPDFGLGTSDGSIALLAPGDLSIFNDDVGIDFIAEGFDVTPETFFNAPSGVIFENPFAGIGSNDGAVFINSAGNGLNNDNGIDDTGGDFLAGEGGWIVDPGADFTGDGTLMLPNLLTPGFPNTGQFIPSNSVEGSKWMIR